MYRTALTLLLAVALAATVAQAEMRTGKPDLQSAGPLAFSPTGILFVGDQQAAAVFAIDTEDTVGNPSAMKINIGGLDAKLAAMLGVEKDDVLINDLAVNPASGAVYLSVSRGRGPDAMPVLLRVAGNNDVAEVPLDSVRFDSARIPDAPDAGATDRRGRSLRTVSITDLAFIDGKLYIAGISNEEFSSKFRSIPFPFQQTEAGTTVEMFHGSHGRYETASPVRTFTAYQIGGAPHLLAAYTCTPLVKIPVAALGTSDKIIGTTVAELGNRNTPLDMVIYSKGGQDYLLMANDNRGLMKISLDGIDRIDAITERIRDKAGLEYDTLSEMDGVVQLDRLNADAAIALVETDGAVNLTTFPLP